jgi:hypothetical protein
MHGRAVHRTAPVLESLANSQQPQGRTVPFAFLHSPAIVLDLKVNRGFRDLEDDIDP